MCHCIQIRMATNMKYPKIIILITWHYTETGVSPEAEISEIFCRFLSNRRKGWSSFMPNPGHQINGLSFLNYEAPTSDILSKARNWSSYHLCPFLRNWPLIAVLLDRLFTGLICFYRDLSKDDFLSNYAVIHQNGKNLHLGVGYPATVGRYLRYLLPKQDIVNLSREVFTVLAPDESPSNSQFKQVS